MPEDRKKNFIEIPYKRLQREALDGLIEEYVSREGSDYGEYEYSFEQKKEHVFTAIKSGQARIFFDSETESCQLVATT